MTYDVEKFFDDNRELGFRDLIDAANRAATDAHTDAYSGRRGSVAARADGAEVFVTRMREILNYLRYGNKPFNIAPRDWDICRRITERFVERGIMKDSALDPWRAN